MLIIYYHHYSKWPKSPASKEPKAVLKNAFKISNDTEKLISFDIKITTLLFDNTGGNAVYVRTYQEIERDAVLENNLITIKTYI